MYMYMYMYYMPTVSCTCIMCMYMYIYCIMYMYNISSSQLDIRCNTINWLTLPSNQSFYRLIVGFGMGVADCEVGQ